MQSTCTFFRIKGITSSNGHVDGLTYKKTYGQIELWRIFDPRKTLDLEKVVIDKKSVSGRWGVHSDVCYFAITEHKPDMTGRILKN